jgi:hypothetical protein
MPFRCQTHEYTHNPAQFKLTAMERTRRFATSSGTACAIGAADVPQIGSGGQGSGTAMARASATTPASFSTATVSSVVCREDGAMSRNGEQAADDAGMANPVTKAAAGEQGEAESRGTSVGSAGLRLEETDATSDVAGAEAKRQKVGTDAA